MRSGIYMIQNLITGDRYIGSSRNLKHRRSVHFHDMRNGGRGNYKLHRDFQILGEKAFRWSILEFVEDVNNLVEREQYWIDTAKPEYNIRRTAHNNHPSETEISKLAHQRQAEKLRGRKQPKWAVEKRRKSLLEYWADPANRAKLKKTPEQKEVLRQLATGERNGNWGKKRTEEFGNMISELFSSMQFRYVSPEGVEVTFRNLTKFCKDNNLPYHMMRALHQGKKKEYQGWTFKDKVFVGYKKER